MILGKTIKYISFIMIILLTINNIANTTIDNYSKPKAILATSPFDLIIANDIKNLSSISERSKSAMQAAATFSEIDKEIKITNLQEEFIEVRRKYIFNKDINSHLIECIFTLHQGFVEIKSCTYNEKIYQYINEITKNLTPQPNNQIKKPWDDPIIKEKLSNKLVKSIYEKLLSHKFYQHYLKEYLGEDAIANPNRNIDSALKLLNHTPQIEKIDNLLIKKENMDNNNYVNIKLYQYNFLNFICETTLENKLFSLREDQKKRAPLNSPPITVETNCTASIADSLTTK